MKRNEKTKKITRRNNKREVREVGEKERNGKGREWEREREDR